MVLTLSLFAKACVFLGRERGLLHVWRLELGGGLLLMSGRGPRRSFNYSPDGTEKPFVAFAKPGGGAIRGRHGSAFDPFGERACGHVEKAGKLLAADQAINFVVAHSLLLISSEKICRRQRGSTDNKMPVLSTNQLFSWR